MNRLIKFRGLRTDGRGWVYGYYVYRPDGKHLIYWKPFEESTNNTYHEVFSDSVSQFTGLLDPSGKEWYENDISDTLAVCTYSDEAACYFLGVHPLSICAEHRNIIGNLTENKDLLK